MEQYRHPRGGAWSEEETRYAHVVINTFKSGNLPCGDIKEGTSLRRHLAQKLMCSPKRISKKFEGTGYNGKSLYSKNSGSPNGKPSKIAEEVTLLEHRFLKSLSDNTPGHTSASATGAADIAHVPTRQGMTLRVLLEQQLTEQTSVGSILKNTIFGSNGIARVGGMSSIYGMTSAAGPNAKTFEKSDCELSTARHAAAESSALKRCWIDQELRTLEPNNIGISTPAAAAIPTLGVPLLARTRPNQQETEVSAAWPSTSVLGSSVATKRPLALTDLRGGPHSENRVDHGQIGGWAASTLIDRLLVLNRELTMKRYLAGQVRGSSAPGDEQRHMKRGRFS